MARLDATREQILAFRRRVSALDERLPYTAESLHRAAWAGLQDSMPRAALLSIHARVRDTTSTSWEDPALIQVWGPRYSAYVIAARDLPFFTLSRMPDDAAGRQRAESAAARLNDALKGAKMKHRDTGAALAVNPNSLRYGTVTGTILIRWAGARDPVIWTVPRPQISPEAARLEMARRYLHIFGPTTALSFADWAGISARAGVSTFETLATEFTPVVTPIGDAWILASDESNLRAKAGDPAPSPARLLPSGDTLYLLQGRDRELLVPDARRRSQLWTSRVWPGALLVSGEVAGTWRRANEKVSIDAWRTLTAAEREAVEAEAAVLPLPDLKRRISVSWDGHS